MSGIKQPWLGVTASAVVIALSLLAIMPWDNATFGSVVANYMMCTIPFTIVVGAFWQGQEPAAIAKLGQPIRGLAYMLLAAVVALIVHAAMEATVGGGKGDTPFLTFGIILSVVLTFCLAIMWGGWPFNLIKNKLVGGVALLATAYVLAWAITRTFNYAFLAKAPFYPGMDPAGPIAAWDGLVVAVTALAIMFLLLHFDLWPLTKFKGVMEQPALGVVWTLVALVLGVGVYALGTSVFGMAAWTFLVTVPIPFVFGTILLLNMLGGSLTASLAGLTKGAVSAALALVVGLVLSWAYVALRPLLTKDVPGDPVSQSLWLANALLAVTFPLLAVYGDYFHLWPLAPKAPAPQAEAVAAPAK